VPGASSAYARGVSGAGDGDCIGIGSSAGAREMRPDAHLVEWRWHPSSRARSPHHGKAPRMAFEPHSAAT
jgi:hypothetical protein